MRAATLIYGPHPHHLDHLGPLSQILEIPLFLTDEEIFSQAQAFYPALDARLYSSLEVTDALLQKNQAVISCLSKTLIEELFFFVRHAHGKNYFPIWCPHGNSDKGYANGAMKLLKEERAAFIYGEKMLEVFNLPETSRDVRPYVLTGNYRLYDYQMHRAFYDEVATKHIRRKLPSATRTILFAPTWDDHEGESAFNEACEVLIQTLPSSTNLIIKLHPNTLVQNERKIAQLYDRYAGDSHILFLDHYPHIYSLLALCDLYIGDFSSIGYDFLAFNKPMIFLNQRQLDKRTSPGASLFRCGVTVDPSDYPRIYSIMENLLPHDSQLFSAIRQEVYTHTFGREEQSKTVPHQTEHMLQKLFEEFEWL